MKTIKFESNYAAFTYRMTAELNPDVFALVETADQKEAAEVQATVDAMVWLMEQQGIANICYRTVGSNVDKALGVKSRKNGGMGRDAIVYDAALVETIQRAVSDKIVELEKDEKVGKFIKRLKLSFAVTGEYVKGETASSKEAEALWTQVQALPSDKFEGALKKLGLTEDYDDASGIAACQRHIQAEKRAAAERAKAGLGL